MAKKTFGDIIKMFTSAFTEQDPEKRAAILKEAEAEAAHVAPANEDTSQKLDGAHLDAMKALHGHMANAIKAFGPGPHPDGHPVHEMKAAYAKLGQTLKANGVETPTDEPGALGELQVSKQMIATEVEKATASLTKRLNEEIEKGQRREMVDLLKSFKATPFKTEGPDSDVAVFMKMKAADPVAFDAMIARFRAQDEQLAKSDLYKSLGVNGGGNGAGSAAAQLQAKADSIMEKSREKMSKEKAYEQACLDNPGLVAQMRAEDRAARQ